MKKREEEFDISSHAHVVEWCGLRMCTTAAVFFHENEFDRLTDEAVFAGLPAGMKNATLLLKYFYHSVNVDGGSVECIGLICTSRRIFRNVLYAYEGQQADGVFAAADGTYKLHYGNWVLVAFGSYRNRCTERHSLQSTAKNFVLWAYMFVRTEHQSAYEELFRTVTECVQKFFGVDLVVSFGSLDHAAYIANAYKSVWPDITLLDCYPYVARKCREKIGLLNDHRYYDANIAINVSQHHLVRSSEQFDAFVKLCLHHWRNDGEDEYADCFEKVYLHEQWTHWYATSGISGALPSHNALESHNGVIKKIIESRAKTGVVPNDSMPKIFMNMGEESPKSSCGHYCVGPIPAEMIHKALGHVVKTAYYIKYHYVIRDERKRIVRSIFYNTSEHMDSSARKTHLKVDTDRVATYLDRREGKLFDNATVNNIPLYYLSLHEVEIIGSFDALTAFKLECIPTIWSDKIEEIRQLFWL